MFLASLVVVVWAVVRTVVGLVRRRWIVVLRGLTLVSAGVAVGGYALGLVLVELERSESSHGAESSPSPACQRAAPAPDKGRITGTQIGYLPPRFDCRLDDGTTYSAGVVPVGLTPVALAMGVGAILLGIVARDESARAAR